MAIYKPTDCSPFNGTFDMSADLPIILECKVDTSNTRVTAYSIEIYNSNNERIFPSDNPGPIKNNITYLSDLVTYVRNTFPYEIPNLKNVNSGLNGSYLEIPFYVSYDDAATATSTVSRNQMTSGLTYGQSYTWKIVLYQEVSEKKFPPSDDKYYDMISASGTVIGSNEKRIQTALIDSDDDVVGNLVLIDKFIQPIKIDNLSYDPLDQNKSNPKSWAGDLPDSFSMTRSLITGYDSSYGYIYPSTAADNAFVEGQIVPENANGFQIFKNGNNPSNLGATDIIEFIYDEDNFRGTMTWKTNISKPEFSYWEQVYYSDSNASGGAYYPLDGGNYSSYPIVEEERVIFNNIQTSKVEPGGSYYGSPFNGIFRPSFSYKENSFEKGEGNTIPAGTYVFKNTISLPGEPEYSFEEPFDFKSNGVSYSVLRRRNGIIMYVGENVEDEVYENGQWVKEDYRYIVIDSEQTVESNLYNWFYDNLSPYLYEVTVTWNRTTDASDWGTLSNKIVYCRRDGKNYEINTETQIGKINETPFKFVTEKPIKIFNTAEKQEESSTISAVKGSANAYLITTDRPISELISVKYNDVDITSGCLIDIGNKNIIYETNNIIDTSKKVVIVYKSYDVHDYAGVIFYNKTDLLYIRPSININKSMIFKELTTDTNYAWFNIVEFNQKYNYITYESIKYGPQGDGSGEFNPIVDKTRYQIRTFYRESDYNPFSIYKNPSIVSTISNGKKIDGGFEDVKLTESSERNTINVRNFTVVSTYEQDNYIQWKSFKWVLYDSSKRTILENTDEQYDGEISATFYGLNPDTYYVLSLIIQTNSGKIIETDYIILTEFTETEGKTGIIEANFDCDTLSMKASVNLGTVIVAPQAAEYLSGDEEPKKETAYYYDRSNDFYTVKNDDETYDGVASIDEGGNLTIKGENSLNFQNVFDGYEINSNTRSAPIYVDADEIVVEGSFAFSENYQGNIFSISNNDSGASVVVNIPEALKSAANDGLVDLSGDIDKIAIGKDSYLKIISGSSVSETWQDSNSFHNTSYWKENGIKPNGNRINVANFKYAEVKGFDKESIPYPYKENEELRLIDGTVVRWSQMMGPIKDYETKEHNGVTFTNNGDGTFTTNGTATEEAEYVLISSAGEVGHMYMCVGCPDGGSSDTYRITASVYNGGEYITGFSDEGTGNVLHKRKEKNVILFENNWKFRSVITISKGQTVENLVFKPQIIDLTELFGEELTQKWASEGKTVSDVLNYFFNTYITNYLNVTGPYNSYDSSKPLKNTISPQLQDTKFVVSSSGGTEGGDFECKVDEEHEGTEPFYVNQPDRMIWLDYVPESKQMPVVTDASDNNVTTTLMSVMKDSILRWDDDGNTLTWKDGIYVESGIEEALLGRVYINGNSSSENDLILTEKEPITYSNSGLTAQEKVAEKISERNEIASRIFAFKIFINTNNFSVDKVRSYCYVKTKAE